jgi:uncharacterized membrane protein YkoI
MAQSLILEWIDQCLLSEQSQHLSKRNRLDLLLLFRKTRKTKEVCVMKRILLASVLVVALSAVFMSEMAWAGHHHHHRHHRYHRRYDGYIVSESEQYIGREKATSIAYSHAGVSSPNTVRKYDIKTKDKGYIFYEIEFVYNGREYEYEIDASTGEIIHWESERD